MTALLTVIIRQPLTKLASWSLIAILGLLLCPHAAAQSTVSSDGLLSTYHDAVTDRQFDVFSGLQPLWVFHGGVTYLDRVTEDSRSLMQNLADPTEQLNADDFDFDWATGFDAGMVRRWWDNDGFEFRFLSTSTLDASARIPSTAASLQINSSPPIFAPNVTSIDGWYTTKMVGFEVNYHHWIARYATGILGFRYASLNDDLLVSIDSNPLDYRYAVATRNDLYGMQVGLLGGPRICWGGLIVSAAAKVGVFGNDARHRAMLDTGAVILPINESADNLSWLAEANARAELPITRHLSLTGGYTVLWIDQIAIATDQLPKSDFFNAAGHSERGTAVFHGAIGGIELRF